MIVNEKGALSLATTNNACVDLFFKMNQDLHQNPNFVEWIDNSWEESPLDTMKIIFQSRDCRGGKGTKKTFINAMKYLSYEHPEWVEQNMSIIPTFGRYKDWIELINDKTRYQIIYLICKQLKEDITNMNEGKSISLLAKWIPSERKKLNKNNNITKTITKQLYGEHEKEPYKRFRKEYLTPLRYYLKIVENYMCSNRWEEIDFSIVPSCAMNRLKNAFQKHTPEKFADWLNAVKEGKSKINAKQLQPHELAKHYINGSDYDEVIELQWQQIVENTSKLGNFEDSIVLSDVSGSMEGVPMEVSIALGILISSLTVEPFRNTVISFHTNPTVHIIPDSCTTLQQKVESMKQVPWGGTTDLYKVFELILNRAKQYGLNPNQMPKRLYILSDMQFDTAIDNTYSNNTVFESIEYMYSKTIYKRPDIIFWNLRSDTTIDFPVSESQNGVATISGFSPSILKNILNGDEITPYTIMRNVIDDERYSIIKKPQQKTFKEIFV
jgi:hypothetical protein